MHIALPSCSTLLPGEVDDVPLRQALRSRGATVETPAWDDPAVDWTAFDACLIRTTWDYMDRRDQFLEWAAAVTAGSRLWNPLDVIRWSTLKTYLRDIEAQGATIAETIWIDAGAQVDIAALVGERDWQRDWQRAFIKPMVGACARETLPFATDEAGLAAAQAHADRLLPREGLLIQPFLQSVMEEGEYSVIFIDGEMTHAVRKIPVSGDYRVMDDFGATDEPAELRAAEIRTAHQVREICEGVLRCATPLLYARVDFLRAPTGQLLVNEVELVEPSLFFRHCPAAAPALAAALFLRL